MDFHFYLCTAIHFNNFINILTPSVRSFNKIPREQNISQRFGKINTNVCLSDFLSCGTKMKPKGKLFEMAEHSSVPLPQHDLDWSFRFLFSWMQIICIPSPSQETSSKLKYRINIILGFFLWLLSVSTNIGALVMVFTVDYSSQSSIAFWNSIIETFNWSIHAILIQSIIFVLSCQSKNKWTQLHKSLIEMEYLSIDFSKIRKLSTAGIIYVLFLVITKNKLDIFFSI